MLVFEALPIHLCSCDGGSLSLCVRRGGSTVHWCLFSFGAHMCKFLQLIVVVIPFFHFLPKWQPGNAKVRAKQHRACSSSIQGPYEDLDEILHIAHVLMGRTINLLNLYKIQMYYNKLYIVFFPRCTFHVKCSVRFSRGPCCSLLCEEPLRML